MVVNRSLADGRTMRHLAGFLREQQSVEALFQHVVHEAPGALLNVDVRFHPPACSADRHEKLAKIFDGHLGWSSGYKMDVESFFDTTAFNDADTRKPGPRSVRLRP